MSRIAVTLSNRFASFEGDYPEADLMPYFSFHPPGYRFMPAYRAGHWDGKIRLLRRDKVPTGLFLATWQEIQEDLGLKFKIRNRIQPPQFSTDGISSDRDYQNECVEKMVAAARFHGGGLVLGATGTGKTRMTGMFFSRLKGAGCFIVDELTLLKQAQAELADVLKEDVGEVGDSKFIPKRITVATVQTLHLHSEDTKFGPWIESLQVNVIDELHQQMNRRNFDLVESIAPPAVFGLTATLELQKKHVRTKAYALAGPVCYEYNLTQGIEEGYLTPGVVVQVDREGIDESLYGPRQYAQLYSDAIVHDSGRNKLIRKLVNEAIERGLFPIVLVERVAHLKLLSELLEDIPHRVVCGEKSVEARLAAKRKFEAGKIRLILANKVFQKGVDIKRIDCIIDGGAMKSRNRAIQIFGRGVRLCSGKKGLLYFDVGDLGNRFEAAAKSRRLAFKKRGILLKRTDWLGHADEPFEIGEKLLQKALKSQLHLKFSQ